MPIQHYNEYPTVIYRQCLQYNKASDERSKHQLLLDLLQSTHTHFLAILLGYYRKELQPQQHLSTEETLYRHSRKSKNSFGIFVEIFRELPQQLKDQHRFSMAIENSGRLVHQFNVLKNNVIHQGFDDQLQERLTPFLQSSNHQNIDYLESLNTIVEIRNILAHKEGKAKSPDSNHTRDWPLTDEYFAIVNPLLLDTLNEWLEHFSPLMKMIPTLVKHINLEVSEAILLNEQGRNTKVSKQVLTNEALNMCKQFRYLIFENDVEPFPYYYQQIPSIPPNIRTQIVQKVEAKMMESVLRKSIQQRLSRHNPLSTLDKLVLENEATSYHITKEQLYRLIQSEQSKNIKISPPAYEHRFNIWWLRYFAMQHDTKVRKNWKHDPENITGMQHALWKECRAYLTHIKERYLDNDAISWSLDSTNFQQGAMSKIFWGQLYLTEGVFQDALSVGFAVSYANKYFIKTKSSNSEINQRKKKASVLMWASWNNNVVEDMGEKGEELLLQLYKEGSKLLLEYKEILHALGCIVESPKPTQDIYLFDTWNNTQTHFDTVENYCAIKEDQRLPLAQLLSPFTTLDDLVSNGETDFAKLQELEDLITTLIPIFSTIVIRCNSWAQNQGISPEWLRSRRLEMGQLQKDIAKEIDLAAKADPSIDTSELAKTLGFERGLSPFRIKGNLMGAKYKKLL